MCMQQNQKMFLIYNPLFESDTNEVLELQATVQRLEQQLQEIQEIQQIQVVKKPIRKTKALIGEAKAFATFLQTQKNNDLLIANIKTKMKSLGYDCQSKVPHQVLKLECEMLFINMSLDEKRKYMDT